LQRLGGWPPEIEQAPGARFLDERGLGVHAVKNPALNRVTTGTATGRRP